MRSVRVKREGLVRHIGVSNFTVRLDRGGGAPVGGAAGLQPDRMSSFISISPRSLPPAARTTWRWSPIRRSRAATPIERHGDRTASARRMARRRRRFRSAISFSRTSAPSRAPARSSASPENIDIFDFELTDAEMTRWITVRASERVASSIGPSGRPTGTERCHGACRPRARSVFRRTGFDGLPRLGAANASPDVETIGFDYGQRHAVPSCGMSGRVIRDQIAASAARNGTSGSATDHADRSRMRSARSPKRR